MNPTYVWKFNVNRRMADERRHCHKTDGALKFFADRVWRRSTVAAPPRLEFTNVLRGETTDLNR